MPKSLILCEFSAFSVCSKSASSNQIYGNWFLSLWNTLGQGQNREKPSVYAGFRNFSFCSNQASFHSKSTTLPRSLFRTSCCFLLFVSITLFVEIMSRISNCFLNFKLRYRKAVAEWVPSPPVFVIKESMRAPLAQMRSVSFQDRI